MEPGERQNTTRRKFLGAACAATGCGVCGFSAIPVVDYLIPRPPLRLKGPQEVGPLSSLPDGEALTKVFPGSTVLIIRRGDKLTAIDAVCTHLKCIVQWDGKTERIRCNCHGGVFTPEGQRISGPPPKDQPSLPVEVKDGQIIVTL